jgi:predicted PurR-regulated permease PerM
MTPCTRDYNEVLTLEVTLPARMGTSMVERNRNDNQTLIRQALPIYYALLLAILTVFSIQLMLRLQHVLLIVFISVLFAATVARPAASLERLRIPRLLSALTIYLAAFAVLIATSWYVLPPLFRQIAELAGNIPDYIEQFEGLQERYVELQGQYPALGAFDDQVQTIAAGITSGVTDRLTTLPEMIFRLMFDALSVFFISLLIVTTRSRIMNLTLSMVAPQHREATRDVLTKMWIRVGYYLQAQLIVMAIVGTLMFLALWVIGVNFPVLLAIVVALGQLLPRIGPWLGRIPLLGVAALQGWTTVLLVLAASIIIENLKGYLISPLVQGDQLNMHPLLVFISVLIGGTLMGLAGAFIAVPAAAMVQVLVEEVILPWRQRQLGESEETDTAQPANQQQLEGTPP